MDKHTFKVGDRVFGQVCTDDKKAPGVFVKMGGYYFNGCIIRRDDGVSGIEPGLFWYGKHLTTHDTDFQVGDWVRYEGVEDGHVPELEGEVGVITRVIGFSTIGVKFPTHWNPGALWNKANLVKIQPPQEEKKMVIQGKSCPSAKIDDVYETVLDRVRGYVRNGSVTSTFYPSTHWEPVEEWVKIEVRKSQWDNVNKCCNMLEVQKKSEDYPDTCTLSWRYPQ